MTTIELTAADEMQLLGEQLAEEFAEVESTLTRFPTGAAMLDVRAGGQTFVMAYSPRSGFGVDEVRVDEGLGTGYRLTFADLSNAASELGRLLRDAHVTASSQPSLSLIVLQSRDAVITKEFYSRLGLSFQEEQHGSGPRHFAATLGQLVLEIYPCPNNTPANSLRVGFRVPSVDATVESLREYGARIVSEPKDSPWGRRTVVMDPDGNKVELTQIGLA